MELNKDGINFDLYYLLWKQQDFIKSGEEWFKIKIPQTIVIKENQPFAWYFTNSEGFLKRRTTKKLNLTEIFRVFSSKCNGVDVVAYFMHQRSIKNENSKNSYNYFYVK